MTKEDRKLFESITPSKLVAILMVAEAEGEPLEGRVAVAHVAKNRLKAKVWGDTYSKVILAPKQFSCFNENDPRFKVCLRLLHNDRDDDPLWKECKYLALGVVAGLIRDNTKGATHYHTTAVHPYWADSMKEVKQINNHIFYV